MEDDLEIAMARAPRVGTSDEDDKDGLPDSIPTADRMKQHELEHAIYQRALLRHMTLLKAWQRGLFDDDMASLYDKAKASLPRAKAQSPEHVTVAMVEHAFLNPEERFPDIANDIIARVEAQEVKHVLDLLNHQKNAKLSHLRASSKANLLAIARDPHVRRSMQYDMVHEREFDASSSKEGGKLQSRIEAWIEEGCSNDIAKGIRRGIKTALPFIGLAGSVYTMAGMGVTLAVAETLPLLANLKLGKKALQAASRQAGERMSLTADRIMAIPESIGQWFNKGHAKKNADSAAAYASVVGAIGLLGYVSHHYPGLGENVMVALSSFDDIKLNLFDNPKEASGATQQWGSTASQKSASAVQGLMVGAVLTGIINTYQSRFNLDKAGSFFKNNPLNLGTPTLDMAVVDEIGKAMGATTPLEFSTKDALDDWKRLAAQLPATPSYQQGIATLADSLRQIDEHPSLAADIVEAIRPKLAAVYERIATDHQALLEDSDLTKLARRNPIAARLLTEMADAGGVESVFMEAAGMRLEQDGAWALDDRVGAGRHGSKVAGLMGDIAEIKGEIAPAPAEPSSQAQEAETMVTPRNNNRGRYSPSI